MNELISIEVKNSVGTITDNLDKVEVAIKESLKDYEGMIVTEDSIQDSKKVLANIRKEQKALDDERKTIKKAWMAPYEDFEKRAKNIIKLYDEPIGLINGQLAEYEEQRKQEKKKLVTDIYLQVKTEQQEDFEYSFDEWISLDKIYNAKWENSTYSEKNIKEDMEQAFSQIKLSVGTIKSMESEFEQVGLEILKNTGDLQSAIRAMQERKRIKEEIIAKEETERKAKEEAEQRAKEEAAQELKTQEETKEEQTETIELVKEKTEELPFAFEKNISLKVKVKENMLNFLTTFLEENNIKYEVCDE